MTLNIRSSCLHLPRALLPTMFLEFLHGKLVAKAESCGQTMSLPCRGAGSGGTRGRGLRCVNKQASRQRKGRAGRAILVPLLCHLPASVGFRARKVDSCETTPAWLRVSFVSVEDPWAHSSGFVLLFPHALTLTQCGFVLHWSPHPRRSSRFRHVVASTLLSLTFMTFGKI